MNASPGPRVNFSRYVFWDMFQNFFFQKNFSKISEKLVENFSIYCSNFVIFSYSLKNDCSEKKMILEYYKNN